MNLLIVDDTPTSLKLLRAQLEAEGHAVFEAHDGVDALALLERQRVDAVISDILMPHMDGYRLCQEIRRHVRLRDLPIILYTASFTSPADAKLALDAGADKFLTKPASVETILAALHEAIAIPHAARQPKALQEVGVLKQYNERLVFKLVEKNTEFQAQTEALRESVERLRFAMQASNVGLWDWALRTNQVIYSREWKSQLGYEETEIRNEFSEWERLVHPDDLAAAQERIQRYLARPEGAYEAEFRMRHKDGTWRWIYARGEFFRDANGEAVRMMGCHIDFTERKQADATLRQSEARLQEAQRIARLGSWDWDITTNALYWSDEIYRIFELTPQQFNATYPAFIERVHPLDRSRVVAAVDAAVHAAAPYDIEHRIVLPDGRERTVHENGFVFRDETGRSLRMVGTMQDITERKAAEDRIRRLNRMYAMLSGINSLVVRMRDRDGLFDEACRIAVEQGQFRLAWIGQLDANGMDVTPVARAGADEGYLDNIQLTARDDALDCGEMVTRALREKAVVVCNDIDTDPQMARWREEALRRGYRSVVVFPLQLEDKVMGLLLLYASEKDFFNTDELKLLRELTGDISFALDHIQKEERLNYLAYFDTITGLPNRALFQDRVEQRIRAAHHDRQVFSVIMLDLERFGSINESLGRQAGDSLLRQLAQRLKQEINETYILARLSADYFGIATRHDDAGADIAHVLEKILSGIKDQPFLVGGQELRVSARAGVSSYPADGADIEILLRNAEAALKKAKLSGDKHLFYAPEFNAQVAEKLSLENKLRRALEQEQLVLYYQPKVNLKDGQICGLEALLRWNDPETGLVPPMKFIPLLEETGMILEAGRWALAKAVSDSLAWQSKGLRVPRIAVNVSPIQLRQKDFVDMVAQVICGVGNTAVKLELEITESLIMQDIEANIQKLQSIQEMGIEVAIDDFGTGYSSLSYLAKLPVNVLKIDRAFIINMTSNPNDLSLVSTIISLAHSLNLRVVAEGVETEAQANLLRLHKCDEIQGYLFSPAVPAEQIEEFLREKKSLPH